MVVRLGYFGESTCEQDSPTLQYHIFNIARISVLRADGTSLHTADSENMPSYPIVEYHPYTWVHYSQYNNNNICVKWDMLFIWDVLFVSVVWLVMQR